MNDHITVTGLVATTPRHIVTSEGLAITSFRLASSQRRYDRGTSSWVDGETNWYTVTGFRRLALNAAGSIGKGDRVVVTGKLKVRDWNNGERGGTTVEVEADSLGHDLLWGTSVFTRVASSSESSSAEGQTASEQPEGADQVDGADGAEASDRADEAAGFGESIAEQAVGEVWATAG